MLSSKERTRGQRARQALTAAGRGDIACLPQTIRDRKPPEWNAAAAAARKRRDEARHEFAQVHDEYMAVMVDPHATELDRRKAVARLKAAEIRKNAAHKEMAAAKQAWDAERSGRTKEILRDIRPVLHGAFCYLSGAVETAAAREALNQLAGELELPKPTPTNEEPDLRTAAAMVVVLSHALDELWRQFQVAGLKWSRERNLPPSKTLALIVDGLG